jgi:hypothetical protein
VAQVATARAAVALVAAASKSWEVFGPLKGQTLLLVVQEQQVLRWQQVQGKHRSQH